MMASTVDGSVSTKDIICHSSTSDSGHPSKPTKKKLTPRPRNANTVMLMGGSSNTTAHNMPSHNKKKAKKNLPQTPPHKDKPLASDLVEHTTINPLLVVHANHDATLSLSPATAKRNKSRKAKKFDSPLKSPSRARSASDDPPMLSPSYTTASPASLRRREELQKLKEKEERERRFSIEQEEQALAKGLSRFQINVDDDEGETDDDDMFESVAVRNVTGSLGSERGGLLAGMLAGLNSNLSSSPEKRGAIMTANVGTSSTNSGGQNVGGDRDKTGASIIDSLISSATNTSTTVANTVAGNIPQEMPIAPKPKRNSWRGSGSHTKQLEQAKAAEAERRDRDRPVSTGGGSWGRGTAESARMVQLAAGNASGSVLDDVLRQASEAMYPSGDEGKAPPMSPDHRLKLKARMRSYSLKEVLPEKKLKSSLELPSPNKEREKEGKEKQREARKEKLKQEEKHEVNKLHIASSKDKIVLAKNKDRIKATKKLRHKSAEQSSTITPVSNTTAPSPFEIMIGSSSSSSILLHTTPSGTPRKSGSLRDNPTGSAVFLPASTVEEQPIPSPTRLQSSPQRVPSPLKEKSANETDEPTVVTDNIETLPMIGRLGQWGGSSGSLKISKGQIGETTTSANDEELDEEEWMDIVSRTNKQPLTESMESIWERKHIAYTVKNKLPQLDLKGMLLTAVPSYLFTSTIAPNHLVKLELSHNRLTSVPAGISALSSLTELNLSRNYGISTLPPELFKLTNLQMLDVSFNGLLEIPSSVKNLVKLEDLLLGSNKLASIPSELCTLTSLVGLALHKNKLDHSSLPPKFTSLVNLVALDLSSNMFGEIPSLICELTSLQELNFRRNKITYLREEKLPLSNLENLVLLDLSYNLLNKLGPVASKNICSLHKLVVLSLAFNNLCMIPLDLWRLRDLQALSLDGNPLLVSTVPLDTQKQGTKVILKYLKTIQQERENQTSNPTVRKPDGRQGPMFSRIRGSKMLTSSQDIHAIISGIMAENTAPPTQNPMQSSEAPSMGSAESKSRIYLPGGDLRNSMFSAAEVGASPAVAQTEVNLVLPCASWSIESGVQDMFSLYMFQPNMEIVPGAFTTQNNSANRYGRLVSHNAILSPRSPSRPTTGVYGSLRKVRMSSDGSTDIPPPTKKGSKDTNTEDNNNSEDESNFGDDELLHVEGSAGGEDVTMNPLYNNAPFLLEGQADNRPYYQMYFYRKPHINAVGWDSASGPVIVSITKTRDASFSAYWYLIKTKHGNILAPLRGKVKTRIARYPTSKALLLTFRQEIPSLSADLHLIKANRLQKELRDLEVKQLIRAYKIGIVYCKDGQTTEEEMMNNVSGSAVFDEFLEFLGDKQRLKGWQHYAGGLDVEGDKTGTHSVYTNWQDLEFMFHVSTMLPHNPRDLQQVETKKRHIGNDVVVIVFVDGRTPFSPISFKSHFNSVFFVIQKIAKPITRKGGFDGAFPAIKSKHADESDVPTFYRLSITAANRVPPFGPPMPVNAIFRKDGNFREWLFTKLINAERAAYQRPELSRGILRTREVLLSNTVSDYVPAPPKEPTHLISPPVRNTAPASPPIGLSSSTSSLQTNLQIPFSSPTSTPITTALLSPRPTVPQLTLPLKDSLNGTSQTNILRELDAIADATDQKEQKEREQKESKSRERELKKSDKERKKKEKKDKKSRGYLISPRRRFNSTANADDAEYAAAAAAAALAASEAQIPDGAANSTSRPTSARKKGAAQTQHAPIETTPVALIAATTGVSCPDELLHSSLRSKEDLEREVVELRAQLRLKEDALFSAIKNTVNIQRANSPSLN